MLVGNRFRITATIRDPSGALYDPNSICLVLRRPSIGKTSAEYPSNATIIVRASTGIYYVELLADRAGDIFYEWSSKDSNTEFRQRGTVTVTA